MKPIEYIIIAISSALVVFTIVYNVIKRKRRKVNPCAGCPDCSACAKYGCGCCEAKPDEQKSDNEK